MRLIDGDALQQEFEDLAAIQCNKDAYTTCARMFKESAERVEDAKTVDAVQVVRCKDCRFHEQEEPGIVYCPATVGGWVEENWFCKGGERRSER